VSKRHKLAGLIRRIDDLKRRISSDQALLEDLSKKASLMSACVIVDEMPEDRRNELFTAFMPNRSK